MCIRDSTAIAIKNRLKNNVIHSFAQCLKDLQNSSSPEASKLTEFLARNEVEELLEAHDTIVCNFFPDTESDLTLKQEELVYHGNISQDPNIKIIKIEKTNEPLVSEILSSYTFVSSHAEN